MFFIFEVLVKPGYQPEQYAQAWVEASKLIQSAPGARGTRLHRKIGADDQLLAIASWDSKSQRDAMEGSAPEAVQKIIAEQAEFVTINVIGEFEDPEWEVIPGQ